MEIKTKESAISARDVIADHLSPIGDPAQKGRYLYHADAILSALRSAGFAVVPVEPTQKMLDAIWPDMSDAVPLYKAMVKAAQDLPPPPEVK